MSWSKTVAAIVIGFTLACSSDKNAASQTENSAAQETKSSNASDLPDPCSLVTDAEVSDLLWQGMEAGQRTALQAKNATHTITQRVENVEFPAGRTCFFQHRLVAADSTWSEGNFELRTLARQTFQMFADDKHKQEDIAGVGDQAFYKSNAAYARRGDVGVEVVNFNSKPLEIELLKHAVSRLK